MGKIEIVKNPVVFIKTMLEDPKYASSVGLDPLGDYARGYLAELISDSFKNMAYPVLGSDSVLDVNEALDDDRRREVYLQRKEAGDRTLIVLGVFPENARGTVAAYKRTGAVCYRDAGYLGSKLNDPDVQVEATLLEYLSEYFEQHIRLIDALKRDLTAGANQLPFFSESDFTVFNEAKRRLSN